MLTIRHISLAACLLALLCLPCCTSNGDANNELDMQGTEEITVPDVSTKQMSNDASTSHGPSHHQRPAVIDEVFTIEPSASNSDRQSTDSLTVIHNVATVSELPDNVQKTNLPTQTVGSVSNITETSTQLPVPIKEDPELPAPHRLVSTISDDASTFLADQAFVTMAVTDEPQARIENDAHKLLTTESKAHETESHTNIAPSIVTAAEETPSASTAPVIVPAPQVSIELDISDKTDDPMQHDQQSSDDGQSDVREEHTTAEEEAAILEVATVSEPDLEIQTEDSKLLQPAAQSTTKDTEHSAPPATEGPDLSPAVDHHTVGEETRIPLTSAQDVLTTFPLPVIIPVAPSEPPTETSTDPPIVPPETDVEDDSSVLGIHHTTVWESEEREPSTDEDSPMVEIAALHPLHGTTTRIEMFSSPLPDTQYQTVDPAELETTNILTVIDDAEDSAMTTEQPMDSSILLIPLGGEDEADNTTISETSEPPTAEDAMQIVTTSISPAEETIISPGLFPELTDPRLWANGTTDDSNNASTISIVLEDLTPTLINGIEDSSVESLYINETSYPAAVLTPDEPNRTHKDSEDLSELEHSNAVTVIFYVPDPKITNIHWNEERNQAFRVFVARVLNEHEERRWPELYKNNGSFIDRSSDWAKRRKRETTQVGIVPEDLVYINPAPLVENRYIYVVFFVSNSSTSDPYDVVIAPKIVHALNSSRSALEEKLNLNITRITTGIIIVKYMAPFFERHALIFIVLLAVAAFCILLIIIGLLYMRCRNGRGNWKRKPLSDEKALKKDMKGTNPESGDVNAGNNIENDEPQMTEKYGNGNHVISLRDEDGWVQPYDPITPAQKSRFDFEDTKL